MFILENAHPDWYADELDDEMLWRLDFSTPEYREGLQAQLFAKPYHTERRRLERDPGYFPSKWVKPRLVLERDQRDPANNENRVDYACDGWSISEQLALELLTAPSEEAVKLLSGQIATVLALPCDRKYTGTIDEQQAKGAF